MRAPDNTDLESFVSSAVILLIAASLMVILSKRLGLGSIAGLLVAGIIVGPYTPGPYITTHVEQAALVVLSVDRERSVLQAISHVRNNYPRIPIIVRARDLEASGRMIGVPTDNVDLLCSDAPRRDYELVDPG